MNILFRADGNPEIGAGHIMRCLSLAQALQDQGGEAVFLSSDLDTAYAKRLKEEQCTVCALKSTAFSKEDADETLKQAKKLDARWIVLDGYGFTPEYQKRVKGSGVSVLVIDDHRYAEAHTCDMLLNQNPQCENTYKHATVKTMLLGMRFAMLRREYGKKQPTSYAPSGRGKRVLITLGGSDPKNMTPVVIRSLKGMAIEGTVIIGGASANEADVKKAMKESGLDLTLQKNVQDMAAVIAEHDFAITAAGSTCLELAFMGVPAATIIVADNHNQDGMASGLAQAGATVHLGFYRELKETKIAASLEAILQDAVKLQTMSNRARALIDGQGAERVLMRMTENRLRLRNAREEDCKMIWEWANDPVTRQTSFSSEDIPWETHVAWFRQKLNDGNHRFYVAFNENDEPVGQLRFDCEGKDATISVSIAPAMRGKKYATELVTLGCRYVLAEGKSTINAFIKPENAASVAVFTKAGFEATKPTTLKGHTALHYILNKNTLKA
ncbi:UDP-2,4-diacetamido-2,4,6-trideoxy-beta-L-altropyranose hydrolase [Candidatus Peregrinibacteria bacterium]|nr:UDP-2,4-diacetamido-2,4,6-trideoxy-beta-L-altropyranose hydrolase [Candidatus Peregrinibacteria bacterium]